MDHLGIFNSTVLVEKNLDLRSKKHNMVVSNIANMDTPNYKPFNFVVEKELEKIMGSEEKIQVKRSHHKHLSRSGHCPAQTLSSGIDNRQVSILKGDKGIDIDKAMADLSENSILYNASVQILSKKFNALKQAIMGGSS